MAPRLTVILPLKGRYLFTLRFLWHANQARLPYHFLVADGQVNEGLAQLLLRSHEVFPELDIEYIRYENDVDFCRFYAKMSDALSRVRTPYAMLADNDDFLVRSGIDRSLEFLERNPDYVCCGGGLGGLAVYAGPRDPNKGMIGRVNRYSYRYTYLDRSEDFSSSCAVERLRRGSRNWWSYYAVFRTDALAAIWREIVDIDFSDLQLFELYCAMRTLTLGKARSDAATIAYLRQYGTSQQSSFKKDWVHHLLRSRFTSDFSAMLDRISAAAAAADGVDAAPVAEMLRGICEGWLREFLHVYYGPLQTVKQAVRDYAPEFMNWLKKRRRFFVARERAAIFAKLSADGAPSDYLNTFDDELRTIENVIAGGDFARFAQPYMPAFVTADAVTASAPAETQMAAE